MKANLSHTNSSSDEDIIVINIPEQNLVSKKKTNDENLPPITLNQKLLYMTYGMLSVLILLNILKFCGWWPFKLNLEVLTPPDIDVEFSSLPKMVNAKHVVIDNRFLAGSNTGEALFRAQSPLGDFKALFEDK